MSYVCSVKLPVFMAAYVGICQTKHISFIGSVTNQSSMSGNPLSTSSGIYGVVAQISLIKMLTDNAHRQPFLRCVSFGGVFASEN